MKLSDYLKKQGIKKTEFSRRVKVSYQTVARWCNGTRKPDSFFMSKIAEYTNYQVTANDFYGIEEKSE